MTLAALELMDYVVIGVIVACCAGGGTVAASFRAKDRRRLKRVEDKLDLLLAHHQLKYVTAEKSAWQDLADDPGQKIAAIKAYRDETGAGLAEAKQAVEEYIADGPAKS